MPKIITAEERQAIIETLKRNRNKTQTAKLHHVSVVTVRGLAKAAKVEMLGRFLISDEKRQAIIKTLKNTRNQTRTAKRHHVSETTVGRLARAAKIGVSRGRPRKFVYVRPAMFTRKPKTTPQEPT